MICKICSSHCSPLFKTKVLNKYHVEYYKCSECEFIQTEDAYWLAEAYSSAITKLDIGLIYRNQHFSDLLPKVISDNFDENSKFIDYGGGYGMFVRIMRDKGFNFYRQDIYCDNLFAEFFDVSDLKSEEQSFEMLTAFEVFEHLDNPLTEISKMLRYSDSILFSTELQPIEIRKVDDWWYFVPETGQHISLYHSKSLEKIAKHFQMNIYSNGSTLHLLTRKHFEKNPLIDQTQKHQIKRSLLNKIIRKLTQEPQQLPTRKKESLLMKDFAYIKSLLK